MRLLPKPLGLAKLPVRRVSAVTATGGDVWLFTGCVMDAWQRETHVNTTKLLDLIGQTYNIPGAGGGCCGALHIHAGLEDTTKKMARNVMASMPGDAPVIVNSAGCGAALKDYGHLLGTPKAEAFSARVFDACEYLAEHVDKLPTPAARRQPVIVQDPCHLRHVQGVITPVRTLLSHVADVVELDDQGLCCGAGGAYSVLQPELAGQIRDRKVESIERAQHHSEAATLASANPGCSMHLASVLDAGSTTVQHPIDIVADALKNHHG
jgi:glycolate oxidase iron-sulfur subunit